MAALALCGPVQGQSVPGGAGLALPQPADTVWRALGPQFQRGRLHRWLWGDDYRTAWATDIPIPVLDLGVVAGGLTPVEEVSATETRALVLRGADGRTYVFRSVARDPTTRLPSILVESPAGDALRDQVSAEHPLGPVAAHRLSVAAGVPSQEYVLVAMPDDPRLGRHRATFGSMLGLLSERPVSTPDAESTFGGFAEIIEAHDVFDRIISSHEDVIDSKRFLTARLLDLLMGDWDRGRLQWRWGREPGSHAWVAIPRDHDAAFLRLDGVIPSKVHIFAREFVSFEENYPDIVGLHFVAREVDRRFLVDLDWPTWESVALATQAALTDEVLDDAVSSLGPLEGINGDHLRHALRLRRDDLPAAARRLYELLSDDVEIQFTNLPDEVHVRGVADGRLRVTASRPGGASPYFDRTFDPAETREVRLHLWDGADRVVVSGESATPIMVRVVGGQGNDELRVETALDHVRFYDRGGFTVVNDPGVPLEVDRDEYETWTYSEEQRRKPIDWGTWIVPIGDVGISSDYGLFVGGGINRYTYGFRREPYASKIRVFGGISTQAKMRLEVEGDFRAEGSSLHRRLFVGFSQLNVVNFYGFGNDTQKPDDARRYRLSRHTLRVEGAQGRQIGRSVDLTAGLSFEQSRTVSDENPLFVDSALVYGAGSFAQLAVFANGTLDTRDVTGATAKGVRVDARASFYPSIFSVQEGYTRLEATGSTFFSARSLPFNPTLALRGGASHILGTPPFFNAALLGGGPSLRGYDAERFAGDTSLFGTAEFRILIDRFRVAMLGDIGALGFVDMGRVWVDGESPGNWHVGYGGGVWLTALGPQNTVSGVVAFSEEQTSFYFWFGMPF